MLMTSVPKTNLLKLLSFDNEGIGNLSSRESQPITYCIVNSCTFVGAEMTSQSMLLSKLLLFSQKMLSKERWLKTFTEDVESCF